MATTRGMPWPPQSGSSVMASQSPSRRAFQALWKDGGTWTLPWSKRAPMRSPSTWVGRISFTARLRASLMIRSMDLRLKSVKRSCVLSASTFSCS